MKQQPVSDQQVKDMLINPYYAIQFDESLFGEHPPLVDEATWIKAQGQLLEELGSDAYFRRLLDVLKGNYKRVGNERSARADG